MTGLFGLVLAGLEILDVTRDPRVRMRHEVYMHVCSVTPESILESIECRVK